MKKSDRTILVVFIISSIAGILVFAIGAGRLPLGAVAGAKVSTIVWDMWTAPPGTLPNGLPGFRFFGYSVDIDGDRVIPITSAHIQIIKNGVIVLNSSTVSPGYFSVSTAEGSVFGAGTYQFKIFTEGVEWSSPTIISPLARPTIIWYIDEFTDTTSLSTFTRQQGDQFRVSITGGAPNHSYLVRDGSLNMGNLNTDASGAGQTHVTMSKAGFRVFNVHDPASGLSYVIKQQYVEVLPSTNPPCDSGYHLENGICVPDIPPPIPLPSGLTFEQLLILVAVMGGAGAGIALAATRRKKRR